MNTQTPLRFAVLLEGVRLNQWQAECVSRLVASGTATLELIINAAPSKERCLRRAVSLLRYALWQAYLFSLGRRISTGPADPKLFHDVEVFSCEGVTAVPRTGVGRPETEQISSRRFDFILYFGESIQQMARRQLPLKASGVSDTATHSNPQVHWPRLGRSLTSRQCGPRGVSPVHRGRCGETAGCCGTAISLCPITYSRKHLRAYER